ncbi:MAG: hypothetical protein V4450_07510 [Bacteroidota bacterium]
MRILTVLLFLFCFSCKQQKPAAVEPSRIDSCEYWKSRCDSSDRRLVNYDRKADSIFAMQEIGVDSIWQQNIRYKKLVDSLRKKAFLYKFTLSRIRYRLAIVENNASQNKYLRGWVIRIVDDVK